MNDIRLTLLYEAMAEVNQLEKDIKAYGIKEPELMDKLTALDKRVRELKSNH